VKFNLPMKRKALQSVCKISGKMKLATTIFVVAFDMQETKQRKAPPRRGECYKSFCLVTINTFTRSQSFVNSG
jgi:hypothetical protein